MPRSRLRALALLPLLVAGAAACGGGGGNGVGADRTAAADAELATFGGDPGAPTCGAWHDASPSWRRALAIPFAAGSGFEEWQRQLTGPEAEAGIDRACARLPGDAPLIEAMSVVAIESIDMDKMLAAEIERLEGR